MKKLVIFSVFLMVFGAANAEIVMQLPMNPTKVTQDQNDGYVMESFGQKIVVFCARWNTQALQRVAKEYNAIAYNMKNQSSFPVSVNQKVVCKHGSFITNDTFTLQLVTNNFVTPKITGYNIIAGNLKPFAYAPNPLQTTNDQDINFTYFNGCPNSRNGVIDNYYLTSTNKCSNTCPSGAKEIESRIGNVVMLILCDDVGQKNTEKEAACKKKSAAGYIWDGSNCVCPKDKVENSAKNQCVNPPRQVPQDERNCKAVKNFGIFFNWINGECKCTNGFPLVVENNVGTCPDPDKDQMDRCRAVGELVATWDATNKKCVCKDSANMVWNGTNCVKTAEAEAAEQAQQQLLLQQQQQQQQQQMNAATNRINNAVSKMSELQQSFGVSAWKTAEGKFNTSRLVSDSVAGVVLGTAGGLITSNIIKKNQIRSGFEDLSCTVGGQVVAEWGDEFSVGIR